MRRNGGRRAGESVPPLLCWTGKDAAGGGGDSRCRDPAGFCLRSRLVMGGGGALVNAQAHLCRKKN